MPRTAKQYTLVPAEIPPRRGRGVGVYAEAVADFVASGLGSALIEMPGRKPQSLTLGLRKAAEASGAGVKVVSRDGRAYLQRV
jgi:hypothetical protein